MAHQQCSRFISHSAQAFSTTSLAARAELPELSHTHRSLRVAEFLSPYYANRIAVIL